MASTAVQPKRRCECQALFAQGLFPSSENHPKSPRPRGWWPCAATCAAAEEGCQGQTRWQPAFPSPATAPWLPGSKPSVLDVGLAELLRQEC